VRRAGKRRTDIADYERSDHSGGVEYGGDVMEFSHFELPGLEMRVIAEKKKYRVS